MWVFAAGGVGVDQEQRQNRRARQKRKSWRIRMRTAGPQFQQMQSLKTPTIFSYK